MYYQRAPIISRPVDRGLGLSLENLGAGVASALQVLTGKNKDDSSGSAATPPPSYRAPASPGHTTALLVAGVAAVGVLGLLVFRSRKQ